IVGYADLLGEHADAEVVDLTRRIRTSALELLHLVEGTMQVAVLGAGKLPLHVQEFAPAELVAELAETMAALPEAKSGVTVSWDVARDTPPARLDRLKLKEIIQNLVSNALKFTREGSVRVSVSADDAELRIAVRDTGPGIPLASQERIFEMFERVEDPVGARASGVGLGLYIVRSLTQLMGGRVDVASQRGRGTC